LFFEPHITTHQLNIGKSNRITPTHIPYAASEQ
jgi:hypothetical protein